jgi:hypothetical protein
LAHPTRSIVTRTGEQSSLPSIPVPVFGSPHGRLDIARFEKLCQGPVGERVLGDMPGFTRREKKNHETAQVLQYYQLADGNSRSRADK